MIFPKFIVPAFWVVLPGKDREIDGMQRGYSNRLNYFRLFRQNVSKLPNAVRNWRDAIISECFELLLVYRSRNSLTKKLIIRARAELKMKQTRIRFAYFRVPKPCAQPFPCVKIFHRKSK